MRRVLLAALVAAILLPTHVDGVLAAAWPSVREVFDPVEPVVEPVAEPVEEVGKAVRGEERGVPGASAIQMSGSTPQGFVSYPAPDTFADAHWAGEPSIGVDTDGRALLLMYATVARATFDDTQMPPGIAWDDASPLGEPPVNIDPLLYTDVSTHRTFLAQLEGEVSYAAITDDGGDSWAAAQPPTAAPSFDHQTIGAGPYPAGSAPLGAYPNAVYYCSQLGLQLDTGNGLNSVSQCARSDTGGTTWNPSVPINLLDCGGLHGKVVVDPTGSVYVPNRSCPDGDGNRRQGVFVSRDAGATWGPIVVPDTTQSNGDPAIAFDAAGTGYFLGNRDGHPVAATTADGGETWSAPVDLGTSFGLLNNEFSMAVAGDAGRAAVAFLGTPVAGDDQASSFSGTWHLYESFTQDGGATWTTVDLTPSDPVQRGCIWMGGGDNPCRNLLDFDSISVDPEGRVLIGYADGCTGACVGPEGSADDSRDQLGTIARQVAGPRLFAAFDPVLGSEPLTADAGGPYTTSAGTPITLHAAATGGLGGYKYQWDFDGDGDYDDASGIAPTFASDVIGDHTVGLRVADKPGHGHGRSTATDTATVRVAEREVEPVVVPDGVLDGAGSSYEWSPDPATGIGDQVGLSDPGAKCDPDSRLVGQCTVRNVEVRLPNGTAVLTVSITPDFAAFDYDLRVYAPDGTVTTSAGAPFIGPSDAPNPDATSTETVSFVVTVPGIYRIEVDPFTTVDSTYTGVATLS